MKAKDNVGIAAVLFASTIWGTSFVLAKVALGELHLAHVLFYRFLLGALPFVPVLMASRNRVARRDLPLIALTGFLMVPVTFFLQFGGLTFTSATSTALLIGTGGPLLALGATLFEKEGLDRRGWWAIAVSSFGVVMLVGVPGAGNDWRGNVLVLASMVVSVVWVLLSKRLVARYGALRATGLVLVSGTLWLLPVSLAWAGAPPIALPVSVWASLVGLGLGCTTMAYVLWNWGVARIGAGRSGVLLNLEPISGAVLGILVLGDPVGVGVLAGGTLILISAGIVSVRGVDPSGCLAVEGADAR